MEAPLFQLLNDLPPTFGSQFLRDHAGQLISEPRIAVVELIANSYDAGATDVKVLWPEKTGELFQVEDDGTGMTPDEFQRRWRQLSYNRSQEQGTIVQFPPGVRNRKERIAFGMSGKGRHSAFCFADSYEVETWRDGHSITVKVVLTNGGEQPFRCSVIGEGRKPGNGTKVSVRVERQLTSVDQIREWIGSKFIVDPSFKISINGQRVFLTDLRTLSSQDIEIAPYGKVVVHQIHTDETDRTTRLRGVTWWVNRRMVGQPSWDGLDDRGSLLDGRTAASRRYSFVVEADILKGDVKVDWSDFHASKRSNEVRDSVRKHIIRALDDLLASSRKARKKEALEENRRALGDLSSLSRKVVSKFVDEVQERCPTLSQGDLTRTVEVFAKMEQARSGYDLLRRLAACSADDIDGWNRLMTEWTADTAEIVLDELGKRLGLITQLESLVNVATTDELHELQPLFERGLWMFGPEYEAVDFTSNRAMATVIRKFLGGATSDVAKMRTDLVALPDSSIGIYAADAYDDGGDVSGVRKVLIVELKKGGFEVTLNELRQGEDYAQELRKANLVHPSTEIIVHVLGSTLGVDAEPRTVGATKIRAMMYDTLLKRAHARTFNLQKKLMAAGEIEKDEIVEEVLAGPDQYVLDDSFEGQKSVN